MSAIASINSPDKLTEIPRKSKARIKLENIEQQELILLQKKQAALAAIEQEDRKAEYIQGQADFFDFVRGAEPEKIDAIFDLAIPFDAAPAKKSSVEKLAAMLKTDVFARRDVQSPDHSDLHASVGTKAEQEKATTTTTASIDRHKPTSEDSAAAPTNEQSSTGLGSDRQPDKTTQREA